MYYFPEISPDGNKIALTVDNNGNQDIYVLDLTKNNKLDRLTFHEGIDNQPIWSPDELRIAFASDRDEIPGGVLGIFLKAADGSEGAEYIYSLPGKGGIHSNE